MKFAYVDYGYAKVWKNVQRQHESIHLSISQTGGDRSWNMIGKYGERTRDSENTSQLPGRGSDRALAGSHRTMKTGTRRFSRQRFRFIFVRLVSSTVEHIDGDRWISAGRPSKRSPQAHKNAREPVVGDAVMRGCQCEVTLNRSRETRRRRRRRRRKSEWRIRSMKKKKKNRPPSSGAAVLFRKPRSGVAPGTLKVIRLVAVTRQLAKSLVRVNETATKTTPSAAPRRTPVTRVSLPRHSYPEIPRIGRVRKAAADIAAELQLIIGLVNRWDGKSNTNTNQC